MNYALIFAGGVGQRMNTISLPKQFLKVHGKEIIVHTIEHFQNSSNIDGIVVVCISEYIDFMYQLKDKYKLTKIISVVAGGTTGQDSIYNGLCELQKISKSSQDIVLIHDGVRPILNEDIITANIECVKKNSTCVTVAKATESVLILNNQNVEEVVDRSKCYVGRAPQSFFINDIISCHQKAIEIGKHDFVDSSMLMQYFGYTMHTVIGSENNIKVTTPMDYFLFKAMLDAQENEQIKYIN